MHALAEQEDVLANDGLLALGADVDVRFWGGGELMKKTPYGPAVSFSSRDAVINKMLVKKTHL